MKKAALIITLIITGMISANNMQAQVSFNRIKTKAVGISENKINERLFFKGLRKEKRSTQAAPKRTFKPKLSADLLVGKGIYLFTIPDTDILPRMEIGARIKAGITITI